MRKQSGNKFSVPLVRHGTGLIAVIFLRMRKIVIWRNPGDELVYKGVHPFYRKQRATLKVKTGHYFPVFLPISSYLERFG